MDEKGMACKDDEWRWGTAQTVIHKYLSKDPLMYEASLSCSPTLTYMPTQNEKQEHILPQQHTGIVDSGATHLYIAPTAPRGLPDISSDTIKVGTGNGHVEKYSVKATLSIPQLAEDFPTTGYIIPSFSNTIIGVGPICDANCTLVFEKNCVTVLSPEGKTILTCCREKKMPRLYLFALKPNENSINDYTTTIQTTPAPHSNYDLSSIEALVRYMHAVAVFQVKSTWIK